MHIDVDFTVDMLMKVYSRNAVSEALKRAQNLLSAGDLAAASDFTEVAARIAERQGDETDQPGPDMESDDIAGTPSKHG